MKKEYQKPVIAKRETLAAIAAIVTVNSGNAPDV